MKRLAEKLLGGKLYVPTVAVIFIVTAPIWIPVTIVCMFRDRHARAEEGN